MIEKRTRLRAACGVAATETAAAGEAFATLKRRGHPEIPPPLVSDGNGGYREALVEVWGSVPPRTGKRGHPPVKKQPPSGCQYLQIVKHRDPHGRITAITPEVVYGDPAEVLPLDTSIWCVERTNLTTRQRNGRLARKTLGFSKRLRMLRASCVWEDAVYNFVHEGKTLRQEVREAGRRWRNRSPAMTAGLTDHQWSVLELLSLVPLTAHQHG